MGITFLPVMDDKSIELVANLAHEIWNEYYSPMIDKLHLANKIQSTQSVDTIKEQIHVDGKQYFLLMKEEDSIGYFSVHIQKKVLLLEHVYLKKEYRGKGFGKQALLYARGLAEAMDLPKIVVEVFADDVESVEKFIQSGFCPVEMKTDPSSPIRMQQLELIMEEK